ncbi:MAG: extracellular solute-binding protein [Desulfovibrio sp.]|jgi:iron(III) transport system substrate-binding protein|nr:extracellular solute-binding protein [Desulfovibrio sp.]
MFHKIPAAFLTLILTLIPLSGFAGENLVLYTSVKEPLIGNLMRAFQNKYPSIAVNYQISGSIGISERIMEEYKAGDIKADLVWTSALHRFYAMEKQGLFEPYLSPAAPETFNALRGSQGYFSPTRFITLAIAYNTDLVKEAPQEWSDIFDPEFYNAFGVADPAISGTSFAALSLLVNRFGWDFVERFAANLSHVSADAETVVDETARGKLKACLAATYIVRERISKGAPLALAYPPEMLLLPTPIAIFAQSPNLDAAKQLVDFLLSREAQTIIAMEGSLPVRLDVTTPAHYNLPSPQEALSRAILGDYIAFAERRVEILTKFAEIMRRRGQTSKVEFNARHLTR